MPTRVNSLPNELQLKRSYWGTEAVPILARYGIVGGGTGVTDGNTTPGYTYTQAPSATKPDIDYASGEYGFPGMPETFTGLHHAEFTIAGDIDNTEACWTWNSRVMALTKDLKPSTTGTATGGTTSTVIMSGAAWTANAFQGGYVRMTGGTPANLDQFAEI